MPLINIYNARITYKFEIHGKYTLVCDDSATGKTTLCDLITASEEYDSGITNNSDAVLEVITAKHAHLDVTMPTGSVVFVDENSKILRTHGYEKWMQRQNCYFVIITRTLKMRNLPISVDSIYTMHSSGKYHTLKPIDAHFTKQTLSAIDAVIVEDSNSGFEFIKQLLALAKVNHVVPCVTAEGNSNIIAQAEKAVTSGCKSIVVVYDAAAMGALVLTLKDFIKAHANCNFFVIDWESFEYYILASAVFNEQYTLKDIGCKYESLEQFATERLKELIPKYRKKHLPLCLRYGGCTACVERTNCHCVNYTFDKYIYGKVSTLYTVAKNNVYQKLQGVSGVTYAFLVQQVHNLRDAGLCAYHIDAVDHAKNTCRLSYNNITTVVNTTDLVQRLLCKQVTVTNPSALKGWRGFVEST